MLIDSRYIPTTLAITRRTSITAATNRASVKQNKQHNKQTMTTTVKTLMMRLKLQRTDAAVAVVAARGPSP